MAPTYCVCDSDSNSLYISALILCYSWLVDCLSLVKSTQTIHPLTIALGHAFPSILVLGSTMGKDYQLLVWTLGSRPNIVVLV
jgi:hypothetical protein